MLIGVGASLAGNGLLAGCAYLLGNHLFEWHVDKVSVEWQATLLFASFYAALGIALAAVAALLLSGASRHISAAITFLLVVVGWIFACVLTSRMNAGYLWLFVGVPAFAGYFLVRGVQHRRARAA